jgi:hypothetical protein
MKTIGNCSLDIGEHIALGVEYNSIGIHGTQYWNIIK